MFQLYKEKIVLDHENLPNIKSIGDIVLKFKEEDVVKLLLFMYLLFNRSDENPLKEFSDKERKIMSKLIAFGNTKETLETMYPKDLDLIKRAFRDYEKESIDKIQSDIDLYDKKIYQFIELLENNKPEIIKNVHEISGKVTFSTNIDIITSVLDNSIDIILDKSALITMKNTGKFSQALRGGLSPNTKKKLITIKEE